MKNKPGNVVHPSQREKTIQKDISSPYAKPKDRDITSLHKYPTPVRSSGTQSKSDGYKKEVTGLRQLFETQLKELYSAEKAFTGTLPKMIQNASSGELTDTLKQHLNITRDHLDRCEDVFTALRLPNNVKTPETMKGLMNETHDLMKVTTGSVRDAGIISAAQKVKHYEIASYGTLAAFARQLGETKVASILEESLAEEKVADAILSEVAEKSVNKAAVEAQAF